MYEFKYYYHNLLLLHQLKIKPSNHYIHGQLTTAYNNGFIGINDIEQLRKNLPNDYGKYLRRLLDK